MTEDLWSRAIADVRRVSAVERSGLAGSPAEDAFDRLTELAALATGTRRACITIVDAERYLYKSTVGVPEGSDVPGPIEESFCRFVVGSGRPFLVTDASEDPRTLDHPAIALHGIAAWAGYPIEDEDGWVLGTFCLIDDKPRTWSDSDLFILATLAGVASSEVALRRARAILTEAHARSSPDRISGSTAPDGALHSAGPSTLDQTRFLRRLSRSLAERKQAELNDRDG